MAPNMKAWRIWNREEGMTLAEVMIALSVVGVLTLVALPAYVKTTLPKQRLRAAANEVIGDMLLARMRSAATNREYRNLFVVETDSYMIQQGNRSSGSDSWTTEGRTRVFTDASSPHHHHGVSVDAVSVNPVVFRPTGVVTPTTITLKNSEGRKIAITTSIAGRIKTR